MVAASVHLYVVKKEYYLKSARQVVTFGGFFFINLKD